MAKLRVSRKAYTRSDGTRVKAATYLTRNRGKRGRTPKSGKWYSPTTEMGWSKTQPAGERRRLAYKAHGGDNLAAGRALQALSNVTADNRTKQLARADALHFFRRHRQSK